MESDKKNAEKRSDSQSHSDSFKLIVTDFKFDFQKVVSALPTSITTPVLAPSLVKKNFFFGRLNDMDKLVLKLIL